MKKFIPRALVGLMLAAAPSIGLAQSYDDTGDANWESGDEQQMQDEEQMQDEQDQWQQQEDQTWPSVDDQREEQEEIDPGPYEDTTQE